MDRVVSMRFNNGCVLDGSVIYKACSKALRAIENELPEEARSVEVYETIIDKCKEALREKRITL